MSNIYICHYCLSYTTPQRCDLIKHLSRKKKCRLGYVPEKMYSRDEFNNISLTKKYTLPIPLEELRLNDKIRLIKEFHDPMNIVPEEFFHLHTFGGNVYHGKKNITQLSRDRKTFSSISSQPLPSLMQEDLTQCPDDINIEEGADGGDALTLLHEKSVFECPLCKSTYSSKQNLVKHARNKKLCQNRQVLNGLYNSHQKKIPEAQSLDKKMTVPTYIRRGGSENPIQIIQNQNIQTQNIQNQNITNSQNNSIKLDLKLNDFMHDIYDHTHLDYRELSTDFYLLKNFLKLMMENESNHNIMFMEDDDTNAIVYTRDNIRKIPSEKAGFILLEKLYKTMENLIRHVVHDEESREKHSYMIRYYRIILAKYRCDTTYRNWNCKTKKFENTSHGNQLRSRDEYLAEMINVVNQYTDNIQESINQNVDYDSISHRIIDVVPNIEDFASRRLRYRD
jgi:hypothetical protein